MACSRQAFRQLLLLSKSFSTCVSAAGSWQCGAAGAAVAALPARTHGPWAWQSSLRYQSTAAAAQEILNGISATQLRDALADEAEIRPFMRQDELLQFIIAQKAASTEAEAQKRAEALAQAGVVLRFNGMVYLKPEEVSELVYKLLPADPHAAEHNLAEVERELAVMDKQHKQIMHHAQRWARRWLLAGCAVLATQLVGFAYLTWWELSWDVMEPVAYILSLSYSLLAYLYFLYTRGSYFEQKDFKQYWEQQLLEKRMASAGFDLDKYHHLMRTRERYKRYMSSKAAYAAVTGTQHAAQSEAAKLKES